ncbi:MAG TPA: RNA-binding protein, partial [Longilinea sp.]|nr:RNA-binding protein [Longilinea sp.]
NNTVFCHRWKKACSVFRPASICGATIILTCELKIRDQKKRNCMNIYVGNLPFSATETDVRDMFAPFGAVTSVTLIKDKFTGQPRGFGFVEMADAGEAQKAIAGLNGKDMKGRALVVNEARPREERPSNGGGGGRRPGGGGFSNDRRGSSSGGGRRSNEW